MLSVFIQHKIISGCMLILFFFSIFIQMLLGHFYNSLIRETENMASTDKELLIQCKRRFANCYKANAGVANVPVFVDKFLNKMAVGNINVIKLKHLSGQMMLLSVFMAGVGACKGIIEGETLGEILPFYIISLFGLYLFFSVSGAVDISGKRRILKTNMVDYLENNMVKKLSILENDIKIIEEPVKEEKKNTLFGKSEANELEELLKEFLT